MKQTGIPGMLIEHLKNDFNTLFIVISISWRPFTKVNVSLRSSLVISLRVPIRAFHQTSHNLKSYDLQLPTSNISYNGGKKLKISYDI